MHQIITQKQTIAILFAVSVICSLSGPFGTLDSMNLIERAAYWGFIVVTTYVIATTGHFLFEARNKRKNLVQTAMIAACLGMVLAGYISVINSLFIPYYPESLSSKLTLFFWIFLVSTFIYYFVSYLHQIRDDQDQTRVALLDRLPLSKRGALVSLQAEDHYVRVVTTNGSELVLIRLADAIELATPTQGLQLHRSHWIALNQVKDYTKSGGAWSVILSNGETAPISRSYRTAAIKAGIIPARG